MATSPYPPKKTLRLHADEAGISRAAVILRSGGTVAFPTETVYGLGADATSDAAVRGIYEAKGRPSTNPVIVHVHDVEAARALAADWSSLAERLAREFWPGPLTIVVTANSKISRDCLAGGSTVGIRIPNHPVALALLREADIPVAAPSANRSNLLSPTSADAVLDTLDGHIDALLDGGSCTVGIESTVVDATGSTPKVLRPGMISAGQLAAVGDLVSGRGEDTRIHRSPGQHPRHYAPGIPLHLVEEFSETEQCYRIGFPHRCKDVKVDFMMSDNPSVYAESLYRVLREASLSGRRTIELIRPPGNGSWEAIHDRLRRAATPDDDG